MYTKLLFQITEAINKGTNFVPQISITLCEVSNIVYLITIFSKHHTFYLPFCKLTHLKLLLFLFSLPWIKPFLIIMINFGTGWFYVNWHNLKSFSSDCPVLKPVVHFLDCWLMYRNPTYHGHYCPWAGSPGAIRKQTVYLFTVSDFWQGWRWGMTQLSLRHWPLGVWQHSSEYTTKTNWSWYFFPFLFFLLVCGRSQGLGWTG